MKLMDLVEHIEHSKIRKINKLFKGTLLHQSDWYPNIVAYKVLGVYELFPDVLTLLLQKIPAPEDYKKYKSIQEFKNMLFSYFSIDHIEYTFRNES